MNVTHHTSPPPVTTQPQRVEHRSAGYGCDFYALKETAKISSAYGAIGAVVGYLGGAAVYKCQLVPALIGVPVGFASFACSAATAIAVLDRCHCIKKLPARQITISTEPVSHTGEQQQGPELQSVSSPPPYQGNGSICTAPPSYSEAFSSCSAPVLSQPGLGCSSVKAPVLEFFEPPLVASSGVDH